MTAPIKAIDPTSYSHIKAFEQCPKQFYHVKHLNQFPFKENEHTKYGKEMHKAAEDYVRDSTPIPKRFTYLKPSVDALIAKGGTQLVELKMGVTHDLEPCTFFAKDVWLRGIVDLLIILDNIAYVIDYKSSQKTAYAEKDQLELMALFTFAHYPKVEEVRGGLLYPRVNQLIKAKYHSKDKGTLWSDWIRRNDRMKQAHKLDNWPTRESGLCRKYCPVTECIHNGANN